MDLLKSETYKRFFYHGIENKEEMKEGILYFSSREIYVKHQNEHWYKISNEMIIKEIIDLATSRYRQFYRFSILNDEYNRCNFNVDYNKINQELQEKVKELLESGKMINTKAGIFFIREESQRLNSMPYDVYGRGLLGEQGWTKQIYNILINLEKLENENILEYYECWMNTKLQRVVGRANTEEIRYTQRAYQLFQERKDKMISNEKELGE